MSRAIEVFDEEIKTVSASCLSPRLARKEANFKLCALAAADAQRDAESVFYSTRKGGPSSPSGWSECLAGRQHLRSESLAAARRPLLSQNSYNHYVTARSGWAPRREGAALTGQEENVGNSTESGLTEREEDAALWDEILWRQALVSAASRDEQNNSPQRETSPFGTSFQTDAGDPLPTQKALYQQGHRRAAQFSPPRRDKSDFLKTKSESVSSEASFPGDSNHTAVRNFSLFPRAPPENSEAWLKTKGLVDESPISERRLNQLEETMQRLLDLQSKLHEQQLLLQRQQTQILLREATQTNSRVSRQRETSPPSKGNSDIPKDVSFLPTENPKPCFRFNESEGMTASHLRKSAASDGEGFFGASSSKTSHPSAPSVFTTQRFAKSESAGFSAFPSGVSTAAQPQVFPTQRTSQMLPSPWFSVRGGPEVLSPSRCRYGTDLRVASVSAAGDSRPSSPNAWSGGFEVLAQKRAESSSARGRDSPSQLSRGPGQIPSSSTFCFSNNRLPVAGSVSWSYGQPVQMQRPLSVSAGSATSSIYFVPLDPPTRANWRTQQVSQTAFSPPSTAQTILQKCCGFRKRMTCKC